MKKFKLSGKMKSVAKISSGTMIGQIISIVTLPIITRIYGADIIGGWTTINSFAFILVYLVDLGLSQALMIEDDDKVESLYQITTTISLFLCLGSFVFSLGYYGIICQNSLFETFINSFFVVAYTFTLRQVQTCYIWLNREKAYTVLMKNPIINYLVIAIFSIALGLIGFKQYGYYVGMILGQLVTLIHMKRKLPRKMFCWNFRLIYETIGKHKEFVKYQMPSQTAAQLRQQLPNLLIGTLFGETMLGYFSISQKLISIPINFIGQALGKVFYQTIAEMDRKKQKISEFVERNMKRSIFLAFVPMVLFAAFGDAAIVMFFGSEYAIGGVISRIIVFRAFFTFISTALSGIDIVLRKQKYSMLTCVYQTILGVACVALSYYLTNDIYVCSLLMVLSFIVVQVWYFCRMYNFMELSPIKYCRNIFVSLTLILVVSLVLRHGFVWLVDFTEWPFLLWLKGFMVI